MRPHPLAIALVLVLAGLTGCLGDDGTTPTPTTGGTPSPSPTPTDGGDGTEPPVYPADADEVEARLALEPVADGFENPLLVTHAGDGSGRLFVVEQGGTVRVLVGGAPRDAPFLDVSNRVTSGGERGLLGLAFHPDYAENGRAFVSYTDREGDSVLAEYRVRARDPDRLEAGSERVLLRVAQPYANHNGGHLAFGPDGFLYLGLGDGGSGGDPHGHGQDPSTLLGTILRIDVDGREAGKPYAIPDDNPFADGGDGAPEVWHFGLRNPWRFTFDRESGDMWIGDVGQNEWEEIDFAPAGEGGLNFGWNVFEASHRYRIGDPVSEATMPVAEYAHGGVHCSVTGGFVYRGEAHPDMRGAYFYGDYCSGTLWGLFADDGGWAPRELRGTGMRITSFGEDEAGELYVVDRGGAVHRVTLRTG